MNLPRSKAKPTLSAISSLRLLLALCLTMAFALPLLLHASPPVWWAARGVTVSANPANDFAAANQGQAKFIAKQAMLEMDAHLPGEAGAAVHSMVDAWDHPTTTTNDFLAINVGQLKYLAQPFYDQLVGVGYTNAAPWAGHEASADDFAAANIGQVKNLFSFDLTSANAANDLDGNGIADWWEKFYFGRTGINPNALALGGDNLTNLQKFHLGTNPLVATVPPTIPAAGAAPPPVPTLQNTAPPPSYGTANAGGGGQRYHDGSVVTGVPPDGAVIKLRADSAGGGGVATPTASVSSGFIAGESPLHLVGPGAQPFLVRVSWENLPNSYPVILQRRVNYNGSWQSLGTIPAGTAYYDANVVANNRYFYRIVYESSGGSSPVQNQPSDRIPVASNIATVQFGSQIEGTFLYTSTPPENYPFYPDYSFFGFGVGNQYDGGLTDFRVIPYISSAQPSPSSDDPPWQSTNPQQIELFTNPSAQVTLKFWQFANTPPEGFDSTKDRFSAFPWLKGASSSLPGAAFSWTLGSTLNKRFYTQPWDDGYTSTRHFLIPQPMFSVWDDDGLLALAEKPLLTSQFETTISSQHPQAQFQVSMLNAPTGLFPVDALTYKVSWDNLSFAVSSSSAPLANNSTLTSVITDPGAGPPSNYNGPFYNLSRSGTLYQPLTIRPVGHVMDGASTTVSLTISLGDSVLSVDTCKFTYKYDSQDHPYSLPFDEASGARYRKIALNGRPLSDEKPQHTAESDQQKEETYIDALTLGLRHSTTDVYVPVAGSDLVLSSRRNTLSESWSMRSGLRPHERLDRPFGVAWNSNLCVNVDRTVSNDASEPIYFYVTDQSGSVHRFLELPDLAGGGVSSFVPLPTSNQENGDYLTTLTLSAGNYIFTDRFGTQITYATNSSLTTAPIASDRLKGSSTSETHTYFRATSVADRLGNQLVYAYPTDTTLVPSTITFAGHPGQVVSIHQDSANYITAIWDPNGNEFDFHYSTLPYNANGNSYNETILTSVTCPSGSTTNPAPTTLAAYEYDLAVEADTAPPDSNGLTIPKWHCDVSAISDGRGDKYKFDYQIDHSRQVLTTNDANPNGVYLAQTGAPRNVSLVTLPNLRTVAFTNNSLSRLTDGPNGSMVLTSESKRENTVLDPQGTLTTYTFSGAQVFQTNNLETFYKDPLHIPKVVLYTQMDVKSQDTVHNIDFGTETFQFEVAAGLALHSAKDLSGNTTTYTYGDQWTAPAQYRSIFSPPSLIGYNGNYPDPTVQTNARTIPKTFTYGTPWRIMTDSVDEEGRHTHNDVDALGRRTSEILYNALGHVTQHTDFTYDTSFPGVVKRRTIRHAASDPPWATDLVVAYDLDENGRVLHETLDPDGHPLTTVYAYDRNGNKLSATDPLTHTTSFAYDHRNRLVQTVFADGTQKLFEYDAASNKTRETDENTHFTTFDYDPFNRLAKQTRHLDDGDLITQYEYNDANSKVKVTDPKLYVTSMTYDGLQRLSTSQSPIPNEPPTRYSYDGPNAGGNVFESSSFKPTQVTDPRGFRTKFTYDVLYRTTAKAAEYQPGIFSTTSYGFDNVGNQTSVTEPLATDGLVRTTGTLYDALNRPYRVTYADTNYVTTDYTATGLKWRVTDEKGRASETQYDAAGRAVLSLGPEVDDGTLDPLTGLPHRARPTVQTLYDDAGRVQAVTDARLNRTDFFYDARNRKTQVQGPPVVDAASGSLVPVRPLSTTAYDYAGNAVWTQNARGYVTQTFYDQANRPTEVMMPDVPVYAPGSAVPVSASPVTSTVYDANGNALFVSDLNGHTTTNHYDALNRLHDTTNAAGDMVSYEYDGSGNRVSVEDAKGHWTWYEYDGLRRNTSVKDMRQKKTVFTYDALLKVSRLDANTQVTSYQYDRRERLAGVSYPARPADDRTYGYDEVNNLLSVTLPPTAGGAASVGDVAYTYDELHRVVSETSGGCTHAYTYDLGGNRLTATYGGTGRRLVSDYDALGRLQTLSDGSAVTRYGYDLTGNVVAKTLPDGEVIASAYDGLGRLALEQDTGGTGLLYQYGYLYDRGGNLRYEREYAPGLAPKWRATLLGYDLADRLSSEAVTAPDGTALSTTGYSYDPAGNRWLRTVAGGATTTYAYDEVNELTGWTDTAGRSVGYTYDDNGNRTGRTEGTATTAYGYDVENRLISVDKGGVHYAYVYDYRTRRVQRSEGATTTAVVFSGGTSVSEYAGSTSTTPSVEYVRGSDWGGGVGGVLYSVRPTTGTRFDHYDRRGDVTSQTSAAGAITYQAAYEAWGTRTSEFGQDQDRQRANTKEEDPTGLLDEGQRYRDLETGVFLTRDPLGMVDGPNLYAYVNDNPWTKFDPEGLEGRNFHPEREQLPLTEFEKGMIRLPGAIIIGSLQVIGGWLLGGENPMAQSTYQQMIHPEASNEEIMQRTQNQLAFNNALNSLGVPEAGGKPEVGTPEVSPFVKVKSPSKDARQSVQGSYVDPLTNQVVSTKSTVAADHIVSQKEIKAMLGFEQLTPEQQDAVLNNPVNLQGLPKTFNSSKKDKDASQWATYKDQPLSQDYIDRSKQVEQSARQALQKQIQEGVKQNESNQ